MRDPWREDNTNGLGRAVVLLGRATDGAVVSFRFLRDNQWAPTATANLAASLRAGSAWTLSDDVDLLRRERGQHFDPDCVTALLRRTDEVMDIQKKYAEPDASEDRDINACA